jgi:hypothetical protein
MFQQPREQTPLDAIVPCQRGEQDFGRDGQRTRLAPKNCQRIWLAEDEKNQHPPEQPMANRLANTQSGGRFPVTSWARELFVQMLDFL